jgi:YVTN family beta-propeller protein
MLRRTAWILALASGFLFASCSRGDDPVWLIEAPAGRAVTAIDRAGQTVLPNGRLLTPRGRQVTVAPHPYGLTLSADGSLAVTANSGIRPFSLSLIRGVLDSEPRVEQIPPGAESDEGVLAAVFMGLALSPDGTRLYVGGGQEGRVLVFDPDRGVRVAEIDCNVPLDGREFEDSYIGDLVLDSERGLVYACDQANFRVAVLDAASGRAVSSVSVGRYPFGLALSPDRRQLYVANVGMFAYSLIEGVDLNDAHPRGLEFPPFSFGTPEAREGVERDGFRVPGLGDPNAPESFSVWAIDVADPLRAKVTAKVKTGVLVGQPVEGIPAVGGSSPNSVVASRDRVYVSNGTNDSLTVIDAARGRVAATIPLRLDSRLGGLRGVIPFGLALSPDGRRLYAAEAGVNAVAVIDTERNEVLGHIPVGWFPSKLAVSPDGRRLVVANAKGFGSGPNGGSNFREGPEGAYIGNIMKGTVSILSLPPDSELAAQTSRVLANNFVFRAAGPEAADRADNPIPLFAGQAASPLKHLVFVVKENRTFDEVFGQREGADGDPALARYGADATFSNEARTRTVARATVMPNHLRLAELYALADNFYTDSDVSADGHRWLQGTYPNEWLETGVPATYGGGRGLKPESKSPGTRGFTSAGAAVFPEDYNEAGSIWDHFRRRGVSYFNFGLGLEFGGAVDDRSYKHSGQVYVINYPVAGDLLDHSSRLFPTWNMSIPDQFRTDMFIQDFNARWSQPGRVLPSFLSVYLPDDHGAKERPEEGYPFRESYMADNDLALGRLVEFLSHTRYWKEMAIVVTEDDPQDGRDHVDAHRSLLLVISPYSKKGYVGHVHYSFGSLLKTFDHVLGLPYLNQYDAGATDLADLFTSRPDPAPYSARPADPRVFKPELALDPLDEKFNWRALEDSPALDDPEAIRAGMRGQEKKKEAIRK